MTRRQTEQPLLEDDVWEGYWWLPGTELRVPGILEFVARRLRLRLFGSFDRDEGSVGSLARHAVVFGETSDAKPITVADCNEVSVQLTIGRMRSKVSAYQPRLVLLGAHLESADATLLREVSFRVPDIESFIGITGVSTQNVETEQHVIVRRPSGLSFDIADFRVQSWHYQGLSRGADKLEVAEKAWLAVSTAAPAVLDAFVDGPIRSLLALISLAFDGPVLMAELSATTAEGEDVQIIRTQSRPKSAESADTFASLPFTLATLSEANPFAVQRWHEARKKYGPTFDLYLSLLRSDFHLEHQFIFLVQALESFHRRSTANVDIDQTQHATRVADLIASAPEIHREWLSKRLAYSNEPTLKKRMLELWDSMPASLRGVELLGERKSFAHRVAVTRNYFTHFAEENKPAAYVSARELWGAVQRLRAILKIVFVQAIGISAEQVLETLWGEKLVARLSQARRNERSSD